MGEIIFSKGMQLSRRQYGSPAARWARAGFTVAKKLAPYARAAYKAYSNSRSRQAPSAKMKTNTVSFQHDYSTQYRRRRAPRRVRVRARRRARAFNYQLARSGPQYVYANPIAFGSGTVTPTGFADGQAVYACGLFGGNLTSSIGMDDLAQIASLSLIYQETGQLLFKSAVLDVQIQNKDAEDVLVADVYQYVYRREGYDEPGLEWTQSMENQGVIGALTQMTPVYWGCTPFDGSGFGNKILITKKTKYRIGPGNSVYLQIRDGKRQVFDTSRFDYDLGNTTARIKMFKGLTKGFIIVMRSASMTSTTVPAPFSYAILQNRTYHYNPITSATDRQGADP